MWGKATLKELGTFWATGSVKMFLEGPYNELFKSDFGRRLKQMGITSQLGIWLASGLFIFFLLKKLPSNMPARAALEEILADAWPEFSKRLFNGFTDFLVNRPLTEPAEQAMAERLNQVEPEEQRQAKPRIDWEAGAARVRQARQPLQQIRKRGVLW